ncbi:MAG: von Willebrand factor type A domain-containing protein [Prevotella sp.]|nr:von Willebrand factor type A domain-containing protein [Prevotella sp.]
MEKNILNLGLAAVSLLALSCGVSGDVDDGYSSMPQQEAYTTTSTNDGMDVPQGGERFGEFTDNPFISTIEQPTSTFSIDADGAAYAIARNYLNRGYRVPVSSVRIEELLNYFTFDYASPTDGHHVAINAEVDECPWNTAHKLLRLGIKGKELTQKETPLANYVFLVDVSGSMYGKDRLDLLKSGLRELLHQLNPKDRISLITYSGKVEKLLESTPVSEAAIISSAIDKLSADGVTAGGEALDMAYKEALANYDPEKNNRVIMGTDGDFNVGVTSTEALVEMVESYARQGIYMTCLGFGFGNLNDNMMEKVSNAGNGTYYYIDSENEMMKVLVHEKDRFVSVANDVKCQISFDSTLVSKYRLIGYENRVMDNQDFDDDAKDAGEIGAGQTITALYELELADKSQGATAGSVFATFDLRYKKSLDAASETLQQKLTLEDIFNKAGRSSDMRFAAGVAAFGLVLRDSPYKGDATCDMAEKLVGQALGFDPHGYRAELVALIRKAKEMQK